MYQNKNKLCIFDSNRYQNNFKHYSLPSTNHHLCTAARMSVLTMCRSIKIYNVHVTLMKLISKMAIFRLFTALHVYLLYFSSVLLLNARIAIFLQLLNCERPEHQHFSFVRIARLLPHFTPHASHSRFTCCFSSVFFFFTLKKIIERL